jgi:outer membrane protein assembly factor BamB
MAASRGRGRGERRIQRVDGVAFGKVYAATFTGPPYIFALDATTGALAWQCPATECNVSSFGPAWIAAGVVFVGDSSRQLRAFDATTGALLRNSTSEAPSRRARRS